MEGKRHQLIYHIISFCRLNWTFELLSLTIGKLHIVTMVWFLMMISTGILVFYGTLIWATNRQSTGIDLRKISFIFH